MALALPFAASIHEAFGRRRAPALADLGSVPDFRLTERSGRAVERADLEGNPWLASFLFTRCQNLCPRIAADLARLQERLPPGVRLVSFSVDPDHDTPSVLSDFARRFGASGERWWFLTGPARAVRDLLEGGFHVSAPRESGEGLVHSDRIVLVDRAGRIRRYYRGSEAGWIDEALADLEELTAQ